MRSSSVLTIPVVMLLSLASTAAHAQDSVEQLVYDGTPLELAYAAARGGRSVGVVTPRSLDVVRPSLRDSPTMALGTVDDIVARYSQNHRNVSIFTRAGVLNIVVTRAAGAFVPVSGLSLKGISVIDAFQRMVHAIDPSVPIGGVAEHRRYRVGDDPPADPSITMDVEPTTADNVLNSFVTQIPGSIWIVARSEDGANQGKDRLRVRLPSGMVLQAVMPVGVFRR